jgi:GTP cyclohydrolase II
MPWATFQLHAFVDHISGKEHLALVLGDVANGEPVLARVHSECLTGDALFSQRCDCGAQLEAALKRIAKEKRGVIFYLRQEGRGIGLYNKLDAYALQISQGLDTFAANRALNFPDDMREFGVAAQMLDALGVSEISLITNNPDKPSQLTRHGITIREVVPTGVFINDINHGYLWAKVHHHSHSIELRKELP